MRKQRAKTVEHETRAKFCSDNDNDPTRLQFKRMLGGKLPPASRKSYSDPNPLRLDSQGRPLDEPCSVWATCFGVGTGKRR
jgi:hypothetical protein